MLDPTDGFVYTNALSNAIELNTFVYPFSQQLDITITDDRFESRPKMQDHGEWPAFQYHNGMDIHAEGDIFGADSAGFFTARTALVNILRFLPTALNPIQGFVSINFVGASETWVAEIDKITFAAPIGPGSPSRCAYQITFHSPLPYFVGADTDTNYYYS